MNLRDTAAEAAFRFIDNEIRGRFGVYDPGAARVQAEALFAAVEEAIWDSGLDRPGTIRRNAAGNCEME